MKYVDLKEVLFPDGIVPVSGGGTGAANLADAKKNLGIPDTRTEVQYPEKIATWSGNNLGWSTDESVLAKRLGLTPKPVTVTQNRAPAVTVYRYGNVVYAAFAGIFEGLDAWKQKSLASGLPKPVQHVCVPVHHQGSGYAPLFLYIQRNDTPHADLELRTTYVAASGNWVFGSCCYITDEEE